MDFAVEHRPSEHRFVAQVDGQQCLLSYQPLPGALDFVHTYVPSALRGRGIAGVLVQAGLDFARAQGLRVIPTCWYVRDYIDRHPEAGS